MIMAVSKAKKSEILANLVANIKEAKSIWFTQTNAMTVEDFSALRAKLREVNTTYILAKKTIIRIAIKEVLGMDVDLKDLPGQIWIICSKEDSIAGLSKTNDFVKEKFDKKATIQKIDWVASIFEWEFKNTEDTKVIASMPSRETLLSRMVGSMMSPLSGMARFFDAAAKEVETQGKTKLGELEGKKEETTEEVAEATWE